MNKTGKCTPENMHLFMEDLMREVRYMRVTFETLYNIPKLEDVNENNPIVSYVELPSLKSRQCRLMDVPLYQCDLSVRTLNVLHSIEVETIEDLLKVPKKTLFKCRNCGKKSIKEIEEFLKQYELNLE